MKAQIILICAGAALIIISLVVAMKIARGKQLDPQKTTFYECAGGICQKSTRCKSAGDSGCYTENNCNTQCAAQTTLYECASNACQKSIRCKSAGDLGCYETNNCDNQCGPQPTFYECASNACQKSTRCKSAGDSGCYTENNCNNQCAVVSSKFNINTFDEKTFQTIFPILDKNSWEYDTIPSIAGVDAAVEYPWSAGYKMWRNDAFNSFVSQAKLFTGFANGPDDDLNKLELAAFFGNVIQETGESNFGLVYSLEGTSHTEDDKNNMALGRGAIQLTGAANYYDATFGTFGKDPCSDPSQPCWQKCNTDAPVQPPAGAGFNLCANPYLAAQDAAAGWASALAYWMNRPIAASVCSVYGLTNCSPPPTSHQLIQNGDTYKCGEFCAAMTISATACPSCCISKQKLSTNDAMTINRIKHIVNVARILGYSKTLDFKSAGDFYCKLINACGSDDNCNDVNYECVINNSCNGNKGLLCGGVYKTTGDYTDCTPIESCWPCVYQEATFWPCDTNNCSWKS